MQDPCAAKARLALDRRPTLRRRSFNSLDGQVLRTSLYFAFILIFLRLFLYFPFIPGASHQLLQLIFYYDSAVGRELCSKAAVKDVKYGAPSPFGRALTAWCFAPAGLGSSTRVCGAARRRGASGNVTLHFQVKLDTISDCRLY